MVILQLEDFECHLEVVSILNDEKQNLLAFSPMFVFLIGWANKFNYLNDKHSAFSNLNLKLKKLQSQELSFSDFVNGDLKGKILSEYFKNEVELFVQDYVEFDGYIYDLNKVFSTNVGALPHNLLKADVLYEAIEKSRKNYEINKVNFPELVVFSCPDELIKQREGLV